MGNLLGATYSNWIRKSDHNLALIQVLSVPCLLRVSDWPINPVRASDVSWSLSYLSFVYQGRQLVLPGKTLAFVTVFHQ